MTSTTDTTTSSRPRRITRVFWAIPGVAEGEARTITSAWTAIVAERHRVGMISGYLVICRANGARERVPA